MTYCNFELAGRRNICLRRNVCFVLLLWQQYLDNGCCMIDTVWFICFLFENFFFYFDHQMEDASLTLCLDGELYNSNGRPITAPAIRHQARRMCVHDTICRRLNYSEYHLVVRDIWLVGSKKCRWCHHPFSEKLRNFQLQALRAAAPKRQSAGKKTLGTSLFLQVAACCYGRSHWE